jgi:oxygen-independent coproporphyrinogen-3 oxidase
MPTEKPESEQDNLTPEVSELSAGIYVHIPFCQSKCPYCSFVSYPGLNSTLKTRYIEALSKQARQMAVHPWARKRQFHSLFVGGGTPSSVDPAQMADFITACLKNFDFIDAGEEPEVTVEVNPNTVNAEGLKRLRRAGANRLSIGIQAFSDTMLKNIGRTHTAHDNMQAFEWARAAGFTNINLDLMYGLPGQSETIWQDSLQQAAALSPEHLSVYELTVEPGTPFAELADRGALNLPHEKVTLAMFTGAREVLSAMGYKHYEISNYGRRGFECRHNINYWENGSYIGLGAGAVSCFSGVRVKNEERPERFIDLLNNDQAPYAEAEFLPLEARFRETIIMGLRMTAGVSLGRLRDCFGLTPQKHYGALLDKLKKDKLLEESDSRLRLTRKGLLLANGIMAQLV